MEMSGKTMNVHGVTKVEVRDIETLTTDGGHTFQNRCIAITDKDGQRFEITLFPDEEVGVSAIQVRM